MHSALFPKMHKPLCIEHRMKIVEMSLTLSYTHYWENKVDMDNNNNQDLST